MGVFIWRRKWQKYSAARPSVKGERMAKSIPTSRLLNAVLVRLSAGRILTSLRFANRALVGGVCQWVTLAGRSLYHSVVIR